MLSLHAVRLRFQDHSSFHSKSSCQLFGTVSVSQEKTGQLVFAVGLTHKFPDCVFDLYLSKLFAKHVLKKKRFLILQPVSSRTVMYAKRRSEANYFCTMEWTLFGRLKQM